MVECDGVLHSPAVQDDNDIIVECQSGDNDFVNYNQDALDMWSNNSSDKERLVKIISISGEHSGSQEFIHSHNF